MPRAHDVAMPRGHALHPVAGRQSWRPLQIKEHLFVSFGVALQLESWCGKVGNDLVHYHTPSHPTIPRPERSLIKRDGLNMCINNKREPI